MKYLTIVLLAACLSACGGAVSTAEAQAITPPPPAPPTIAQAELSHVGAVCQSSWTTIPGLITELEVQSDGQPVKVSYSLNFRAGPKALIHVLPVINEIQQIEHQVTRAIGDFSGSGQTDIISYSRIYWLDAGRQKWSLLFSCQNQVVMLRGTLTVELL